MQGNCSISSRSALLAAALITIFLGASQVYAYRICTFKGTVVDHGWRTMMIKSNGQCATVNVGWRTQYIPNRRPCLGERVAVDFVLEEGFMKATKVVSLTPQPAAVTCYPPAPPGTSECRTAAEPPAGPETCAPPKPICSGTPPAHVSDRGWSPAERKPQAASPGPAPAAPPKKPDSKKQTAKAPSTDKPTPPPPDESKEKEQAPIEEKGFKTLKGEVVASSPKSLSIRVAEEGQAAEVVNIRVGLRTKFIPFRRPAVGEKVRVDYRVEDGGNVGYTVQVVQ